MAFRLPTEKLDPREHLQPLAGLWLRKIFLEDWSTKLIALAITLALWFGISGQQTPDTRPYSEVRLNYRVAGDLDISNEPQRQIDITISGDKGKLDRLPRGDLMASIDLSSYNSGERLVQLRPDNISLELASGNDLPYALFLPSYAATAWFHKKLPSDLQSKPVARVVADAENFAASEYMLALEKGSRLTPQERQEAITKLARFTGLDPKFLDYANLRVNLNLFRKELLRSERRSIGRLDSRFKGYDSNLATDSTEYDASEAAIRPPYTSTFNNYVRSELGYKTDLEYYILGGGIGPWNWGTNNNYVDTSTALRNALAKNPFLKVFVAMGYYDMATPYYAVEYTLGHISIDPSLMKNFSTSYYEAGHMMYIDEKSLTKLHTDITKFMDDSMKR